MNGFFRRTAVAAALASLVVGLAAGPAFALHPATSLVEGVLTSSGGGAAADGTYDLTFNIYANSSTTTPLWSEGPVKVAVKGGRFAHALGSAKALDITKLGTATPFFGVKVGADPELPRQAMHSALYALHAATANTAQKLNCSGCVSGGQIANGGIAAAKVGFNYAGSSTKGGPASDLACTGCVSTKEMKFDGDIDLGGNSLKAKNATFTGDVAAGTVTATSFAGDGSKLTGIKIPTGECKTDGEVVKGINADGSLKCVKALDPKGLPKDGLNEISNDLITNQYVDTVETQQKSVPIPDNQGTEAVSNMTFPNIGIAQTFELYVHVENTDLSKLSLTVLPPDDKKVGWVLCDPCGAKDSKIYKKSFTPTAKPKSGDIGKWIGKNPQGLWTFKAKDTSFCIPQAPGNSKYCDTTKKTDGWISTFWIKIQTLSNQKITVNGDAYITGNLSVAKNTTIDGDLTLKGDLKGLSTAPSIAPAVNGTSRSFFGVVTVRDPKYCPKGWNSVKSADIRGNNNYVYTHISPSGLSMGGNQSNGYAQRYLYQGFNYTNNGSAGSTVCWKEFKAPSGKPHVHMFTPHNGKMSSGTCPTGYTYLSHQHIKGNNNWGYFMASKAGFYLGYVDTWAYACQAYDQDGEGCMRWSWRSSEVNGVCFKVYGTTDDPETQNGVFPVVFGMHHSTAGCPSGWNITPVTDIDHSNGYTYNVHTANASVMGGRYDWWYSNGYRQNHFHYSHVKNICWKMLPIDGGKPTASIQQRRYSSGCPSGWINLPWNSVKGWNNHAYWQLAVEGLYFGGLNSWAHADHNDGYQAITYNDNSISNFCVKISNVKM